MIFGSHDQDEKRQLLVNLGIFDTDVQSLNMCSLLNSLQPHRIRQELIQPYRSDINIIANHHQHRYQNLPIAYVLLNANPALPRDL